MKHLVKRCALLALLLIACAQLTAVPAHANVEPVRGYTAQGNSYETRGYCSAEGDYTYDWYGPEILTVSGYLIPVYPVPVSSVDYAEYRFCFPILSDCLAGSTTGTGSIRSDDEKFVLPAAQLTTAFGLTDIAGRYDGYAGAPSSSWPYSTVWTATGERGTLSMPFQGSLLSTSCWFTTGEAVLVAEGASEAPAGPCAVTANRVDRVDGTTAGVYYEADVHKTPTAVEICVRAYGSGIDYADSVRVPLEPNPGNPHQPVQVDPAAPPGDGAGSPCYSVIHEGGTTSTRVYLRSGSDSSGYQYVCFGVGGSHIRVSVG